MISDIYRKIPKLKEEYKEYLSTARYYLKESLRVDKDSYDYNDYREKFVVRVNRAKAIREKLERIETLNKEEFEKSIIALLENYFPDRYDTVEDGFIIYFPEITITSSYGKTRNLTDIYIKVTFHGLSGNDIVVLGTRMSATIAEIKSQYCHSHIRRDGLQEWAKVCFGEFSWRNEDLLSSLELFLINLERFLETESTFTNPYATISSIGNYDELLTDNNSYNFNTITEISFDINLEDWNGITLYAPVDNNLLDEYLFTKYGTQSMCYKYDGKFYSDVNNFTQINFKRNPINFKGQEIHWKQTDVFEEAPEMVINPYFKNQFINHAKFEITKKLAAINTIVSEPQDDNIGETVQEDMVSMFQD